MASIAGFVIASTIARSVEDPEARTRIGLAGALMPSPLLGAIVAQALAGRRGDGGDGGNGDGGDGGDDGDDAAKPIEASARTENGQGNDKEE
jgi:hypothetical protein